MLTQLKAKWMNEFLINLLNPKENKISNNYSIGPYYKVFDVIL